MTNRAPEGRRHGTRSLYTSGCHCESCTAANAAYARKRYVAQPRELASHGTRASYRRGCKCETCMSANREYTRQLRLPEPGPDALAPPVSLGDEIPATEQPTPDVPITRRRPRRIGPRAISLPTRRGRRWRGDVNVGELDAERPRTRGDCVDGPRPCPWIACRHHLVVDINPEIGTIKFVRPDVLRILPGGKVYLDEEAFHALPFTCALDAADQGGMILDQIALVLNVTRERVRQLEVRAKLRALLQAKKNGLLEPVEDADAA